MAEGDGIDKSKPKAKRNTPPKRSYPRAPLETCIQVAEIIKEKNGGNPWPPSEVAKALGLSPKSSNLDLYTASGAQYGIVEGNLLRVFEYDANLWPSTVARNGPDLTQHIKGTWEARNTGRSYIDILRGR